MKTCPYCAETIQDAAIVCKHCGRELRAPGAVAVPPAPPKKNPVERWARLVLYVGLAFAGIVALTAIFGGGEGRSTTGAPQKTMNVRVGWNALAVEVTNTAMPPGGELIVYVNGTPPFTYKAVTTVPAVGTSVKIPLVEFVTKSGDRFNPMAKAVTVVWVGGGGYDYVKFSR